MQKVADFKEPKYSQSMVVMTLKDKAGTAETRQVIEYGKTDGAKTYVVMDFKGPASVKDTRFLQVTNDNGPDDKWIYLPSLKSVRRVNSSEGSKSFLGTDATYDDLSTRDVEEDEHTYLKDETKNGYDCYNIKEVPKDPKSSQYAWRLTWIDKKTMYPIYTEMYDKNDALVKTLTVEKIEKHGDYDIPMTNTLVNVKTGHKTVMDIRKVLVDNEIGGGKGLPASIFTQNFLNTGK
jgi:outer membrane lipoprotein-sorting protein